MEKFFDIVVTGGGTAGVVAAIQAARLGCKTLLIEKNAMPGGTMTCGGIAFPGLFYAWKKQIIAGIGWELVSEAAAESKLSLPEFEKQIGMNDHPRYQVRLNPLIYAALCDEKMTASGVEVLYHSMPAEVRPTADGINVTICTKEGLQKIRTKRLIDCTGDASAVELAGYEVIHPEQTQPATLCCTLSGYNVSDLNWEELKREADKAVNSGELLYTDLGWDIHAFTGQFLQAYGNNANHIFPRQAPHTAAGRSELEQDARRSLMRAWRFLRRQPGLEHLKMDFGAFECGVRESSVIKGEYTITGEDYISAKKFPDAVCNAFYPIDLHGEDGVTPMILQEGKIPQVPLRALIPLNSDFLLAAGRCISGDRKANSALRVQATAMATAQAAAAAAAVSLFGNLSLRQLPLEKVREVLKQYGAILPE